MDAADLRAWRARYRYSRQRLAEALGMSPSRLADYEAGQTYGVRPDGAPRARAEIPRVVELALKWLAHEAQSGQDKPNTNRAPP